jgi:putative chitinase
MDRNQFYIKIENKGLFKDLSESQQEGIEAILHECEMQGVYDNRQIAYILGTVYHEVGGTMQPIEERGKGRGQDYGKRIWFNGHTYIDVSHIYYGRGYSQNTWRDNYVALTKANRKQGHDWDFEHHPELLLQSSPSAWATVYAMKTGLYTGVRLNQYFNDKRTDYINARKIINSLDRAELVAGYSIKFFESLT